ncbi:NADH-quinone oxidoreductase subunit H [Candidatus Peregrinibacteria bacterium]|nr:NADH-quinone oxidoreductase subunit H [Candidatus Peregrinibacteria bacterium]
MNFFVSIYQFILILLIAPFAAGIVKFFKARLQGRKGASPILPYFTILTLMKKQMVISKSTSWVFRLAPFVVLGTSLFMVLILPLVSIDRYLSAYSNFVIIAGILMLGTIFLIFGGLESASAFGGMGSSREMTIASLVEPTMILIFGALALNSGSSEISRMVSDLNITTQPFIIPSLLALVLLALAENARYPVDNPATHLELTMVHEAMILEYSGPFLALIEYASFLKLTLFSVLLMNLIYPIGLLESSSDLLSYLLSPLFLIAKVIVMMFLLAFLESSIVKMRFYRVHEFLAVAFFLSLGGIFLTLVNTIL